jgi:YHS domain-containing protein
MPASKDKANCPVCGMEVKRDSKLRAEYKGQEYYFCSESDKKEFEKHPQVYAGIPLVSKTGKAA